MLRTLPRVTLNMAVDAYPLIPLVIRQSSSQWTGFLSSGSQLAKEWNPRSGVMGTSVLQLVRQKRHDLDLRLASEAEGGLED